MTVSQAQGSQPSGLTSAAAARILAAVGSNRLPDPREEEWRGGPAIS